MKQDQRKEHLLDKVLGQNLKTKTNEETSKGTEVKANDF